MKENSDLSKESDVSPTKVDERTRQMSPQDIANLIEKETEMYGLKIKRLLSLLIHSVNTLHLPEVEEDES